MTYAIELHAHSIVAVGCLNPVIFQPAWFASEKIISRSEAQAAAVHAITPQAALFQTDWLRVRVLPGRFTVTTENEAYYRHLSDLVVSTFTKLSQTPITALGINYSCHCRLADETRWPKLSRKFAPSEPWSDLLHKPRMRRLTMQGDRLSGHRGYLEVSVEPSFQVKNGLFVHMNNHYDVTNESVGCHAMLNVLRSEWNETYQRSKDFIQRLLQYV